MLYPDSLACTISKKVMNVLVSEINHIGVFVVINQHTTTNICQFYLVTKNIFFNQLQKINHSKKHNLTACFYGYKPFVYLELERDSGT